MPRPARATPRDVVRPDPAEYLALHPGDQRPVHVRRMALCGEARKRASPRRLRQASTISIDSQGFLGGGAEYQAKQVESADQTDEQHARSSNGARQSQRRIGLPGRSVDISSDDGGGRSANQGRCVRAVVYHQIRCRSASQDHVGIRVFERAAREVDPVADGS